MARIDDTKPFLPVNIAVLTVSDTRTEADDKSGRTLAELIVRDGHRVAARAIVRDDIADIVAQLKAWIADGAIDVVISTGGTGVTGRDVTPEAFRQVYEKEIEGFGELFRMLSYQKVGISTIQSRATGGTYLFALPRLARRLPRQLGRYSQTAARQPLPALQPGRADAALQEHLKSA
jgi:molybdenum cofactor biosynthesis protein B